jgi:hypothetical protein
MASSTRLDVNGQTYLTHPRAFGSMNAVTCESRSSQVGRRARVADYGEGCVAYREVNAMLGLTKQETALIESTINRWR